MSKRTFFVLFTVMLTVLVAGRVRTLPHAPPLPETLEQAENGWYWGESVDSLAAAVPSDKGLTVYWVDKAQPLRLFFRDCKTSDPAEALKLAAKRPQYGPNLQFDMDEYSAGEQLMINAGMAALREAGTQGNGGRLVEMLTLPRGTHKAGASLVMAAVFEVAPQRVLDSLEENLHPAVWDGDVLAGNEDFRLFAGLVDLQWYYLWGSLANFDEGIKSSDARDYLYVLE